MMVAFGGAVLAGCGGGNSAKLDCAWLASENCWKTTTNLASSCLPPASEQGVLSSDNRSCQYASGAVVAFEPPLQLPLSDDPTWNFTVTGASGQTCLHYEQSPSGSFTLVAGGDTYKEGISAAGLTATCPDGSSYSLSLDRVSEILACPGPLSLPGHGWSSSTTGASFTLIGTSSTSSTGLPVFSCYK